MAQGRQFVALVALVAGLALASLGCAAARVQDEPDLTGREAAPAPAPQPAPAAEPVIKLPRVGLQRLPPPTAPDADQDGDGFTPAQGDCDDQNRSAHPVAPEVCNGTDDDCDGELDEGVSMRLWRDADGDLYGDPASAVEACPQQMSLGWVANGADCDDADPARNPQRGGC